MCRLAAVLTTLVSLISSIACCCPCNRPFVIQPPPVVVQGPANNNPPPAEKKPMPPQPKSPPAVAGAQRTYDLIPIIDLKWDIVDGEGKWQLQGTQLKCVEGNFVPRVQIPYSPPQEYDYVVTFSQPSLRNGVSLIMPKPGGGTFYWAVGFKNGSGYGFDPDHGADLPKLIEPKVQYVVTAQVRQGSVKGLVNGKMLMEHRDVRNLRADDWRRMKNESILGIACDDPCTFHRIQIVEVTGKGKPAR